MNELATKPAQDLLGFIERASKDPTFDVNKFSVLLDRQQELLRQHQLGRFNASFSTMQSEIGTIVKSQRNPIFKNPYASLEDLDREARPIYSKHGFSVRYSTDENWREGWLLMKLTLAHEGGHSEITSLPGPYDLQAPGQRGTMARTPMQAVGSTVTYLRRYTLQMALNLVPSNNPDDDDGSWRKRNPHDEARQAERDEIASDANADSIIEDMGRCESHTALYAYKQKNLGAIWPSLFPPDRERIENAYKELMNKFADAGKEQPA